MTAVVAASGAPEGVLDYGTDWLYLLVPFALFLAVGALVARRGRGDGVLERYADGMSRITGLPGWAAAGVGTGGAGLLIAALGFYWDVSWHVDLGRDEVLFTPAHSAILLGLAHIPVTAAVVVAVATRTRADVALRWRGWRAPWAAVPLATLGLGAMCGFPLDEFWHRAYGIDVTMWGPTHITMIGGASFTPLALLLLVREAGPGRNPRATRHVLAALAGAAVAGLTTFQLEFDLGVAQWQALYHPVLVAIASGAALTVARAVLGPGGALIATAHFLVHRTVALLLLGQALNLTAPRFALYLPAAAVVEIVAHVGARWTPLTRAVVTGAGVGTFGLAGEWAWTQVFGRAEWNTALLDGIAVAAVAALAATLLGTAAGRILAGRGAALPGPLLALAGLTVIAALAYPLPRHAAPATVTVRTTPAGEGRAMLSVRVDPPAVAAGANWFEVLSWQGGSSQRTRLLRTGSDIWVSERPVPVTGTWKSLVRLANDDVLAGAAVYMPADPEIGAPEIPAVPERVQPLTRDTQLLMREAHDGPVWPAVLAYSAVGLIAVAWFVALALAFAKVRRRPLRHPLDGARVVVTGALGGIGRALVPELRRHGADVVGVDLVEGPDVIAADVRDPASARRAVTEAARRLGGIDLLVNLAGIGRAQDAGELPGEEARRTLEVNVFGTWNPTAAAVPWLVESHGHVVVTASGLAIAVAPWGGAYAASKRAVTAYADTLRTEYAGRLTVTTVNPGYVRTPIHDVAAAEGASLEGVVPADPIEAVVEAYVRACVMRPRNLATTRRTALRLWLYRRNPAVGDAVVRRMVARAGRPAPSFVLGDDEIAARRAAAVSEPAQR